MARSQLRSRRKVTGGRYVDYRKKKLRELARDATLTKIDKLRKRILRVRSGEEKIILLAAEEANILGKDKKYKKVKIKGVVENPANRHFVRRNILTKGAIIDTELGKARITSRPGQESVINAVLV
tara:strand:- start:1923 stop:2297 length:375 start_codon:yes stop_codon:yes gene_type:complete